MKKMMIALLLGFIAFSATAQMDISYLYKPKNFYSVFQEVMKKTVKTSKFTRIEVLPSASKLSKQDVKGYLEIRFENFKKVKYDYLVIGYK